VNPRQGQVTKAWRGVYRALHGTVGRLMQSSHSRPGMVTIFGQPSVAQMSGASSNDQSSSVAITPFTPFTGFTRFTGFSVSVAPTEWTPFLSTLGGGCPRHHDTNS